MSNNYLNIENQPGVSAIYEPETLPLHPLQLKLNEAVGLPKSRVEKIEGMIHKIRTLHRNHPAHKAVSLEIDLAIRDITLL